MIVTISLVAAVMAVAAGMRSTWSPCGLSMLSTITPMSERAKGNSYGVTAAWFIVGATVGGAVLGGAMALTAAGVTALHPSVVALGVTALAVTLVAAGSDAAVGGVRLPIHRRQVNERWLDRYRPWVYGSGFGWQIGTGLATYITTAAVYALVVLGALSGRPEVALALGTAFGFVRGIAVLMTRRIEDPGVLRAFHRRFTEAGPTVGRAMVGVEVTGAVALALALHSTVAIVVTVVAIAMATVVRVTRGRRALAR
jgi:hypothetical protein